MAAKAKTAKKPTRGKGKVASKAAAAAPPADVSPVNPQTTPSEPAPIKLTAKEEAFVREFLIDLNATQAAIRAGYSRKTARSIASENLTKPYIQEALRTALDRRRQRVGLSAEWVLRRLKLNVARALQAIPVLDATGKPTGEYRYDGAVVNQACKLIGDHIGMFEGTPDPDDPTQRKPSHVFIVAGQRVEF